MKSRPHFASIVAWGLCFLFQAHQLGLAQQADLRGISPSPPAEYRPPTFPMTQERRHAASEAFDHATSESLAALPNDSILLRDMYSFHAFLHFDDPQCRILIEDLKRRGEAGVAILLDMFRKPDSEITRKMILRGLHFNLWLKPERFLPPAREWYAKIKKGPPQRSHNSDAVNTLATFFSWAGQPQDEALLRDLLGPDGWQSAEFKDFLKYSPLRR